MVVSVAHRTESDRAELRQLAERHGWDRTEDGADFFARNATQVEVHYCNDAAVAVRRLQDRRPVTYYSTETDAKASAVHWLTAPRTDT
ncbi:hypothetical protein A5658_19105 [Mycobacterium sp. 1245111.1]|nr:hypothetical protein A5658_19105 [Mycobacterium sp. 1245111.1]